MLVLRKLPSVGEKTKLVLRKLFLGIHLSWQQLWVDARHYSTLTESDASSELAQFFIILHCQEQMPGSNSCSLVVPRGIASQLKNFSSQILKNSSKVDCSTFPHSIDPASLFQLSKAPSHREQDARTGRQGSAKKGCCRGHIRQFLAVGQGLTSLVALHTRSLLALLAVGLGSSEGHSRHGRGQHVSS